MVCHRYGFLATVPIPIKPAACLPQVDLHLCFTLAMRMASGWLRLALAQAVAHGGMLQAAVMVVRLSLNIEREKCNNHYFTVKLQEDQYN
jgi:hypothetical protein